jgi:hypothetical protein
MEIPPVAEGSSGKHLDFEGNFALVRMASHLLTRNR